MDIVFGMVAVFVIFAGWCYLDRRITEHADAKDKDLGEEGDD